MSKKFLLWGAMWLIITLIFFASCQMFLDESQLPGVILVGMAVSAFGTVGSMINPFTTSMIALLGVFVMSVIGDIVDYNQLAIPAGTFASFEIWFILFAVICMVGLLSALTQASNQSNKLNSAVT